MAAQVLCIYAEEDSRHFKALLRHLMRRDLQVSGWHALQSGDDRTGARAALLDQARAVVLLFSAEFFDDKGCTDAEAKVAQPIAVLLRTIQLPARYADRVLLPLLQNRDDELDDTQLDKIADAVVAAINRSESSSPVPAPPIIVADPPTARDERNRTGRRLPWWVVMVGGAFLVFLGYLLVWIVLWYLASTDTPRGAEPEAGDLASVLARPCLTEKPDLPQPQTVPEPRPSHGSPAEKQPNRACQQLWAQGDVQTVKARWRTCGDIDGRLLLATKYAEQDPGANRRIIEMELAYLEGKQGSFTKEQQRRYDRVRQALKTAR